MAAWVLLTGNGDCTRRVFPGAESAVVLIEKHSEIRFN